MVSITFIEPSGTARVVDAELGSSLKDVALHKEVDGIVGLCGGYANCGTCHIYVAEQDIARLPAPDEAEEMMLEGLFADRQPGSRLACQIIAVPELDGLAVTVASAQM